MLFRTIISNYISHRYTIIKLLADEFTVYIVSISVLMQLSGKNKLHVVDKKNF